MRHYRNFRIYQPSHQRGSRTFDLDRFGTGFFHKAGGIANPFGFVRLVGAERHVGY